MLLQQPMWLLLVLLLPIALLAFKRRHYVGSSNVNLLARGTRNGALLTKLPVIAFALGLVMLIIALSAPARKRELAERPFRSRDIMVAIDVSRSMTDEWTDAIPPVVLSKEESADLNGDAATDRRDASRSPEVPFLKPEQLRKAAAGKRRIDAAQACVVRFVVNRARSNAGDRVGVIAFDLDPRLSWPLTHDLKQIYRKGAFLSEETLGSGTNFGESGPGPIDFAAAHFAQFGQARTKVVILMTDGEADLSYETKERLQKILREQNIKLYVIALGPQLLDPTHYTELGDFTEQWMKGTIFRANNTADLDRCFSTIDEMEKSEVNVPVRHELEPLFMYFVAAGLLLLALALVSELFFIEV